MQTISSNAYSVDDQAADAVSHMEFFYPNAHARFLKQFPQWNNTVWDGSSLDWEASGVPADYICWVIEFIEQHTDIFWEEGEPWDRNLE